MSKSDRETAIRESQVGEEVATDTSRLISIIDSYYRDEMRRAMAWRDRLDATTNWAVILTATLLTWAFSSEENPHYIVLVSMAAICIFLTIEARRYRMYDVWRSRLRMIEENFFANVLDPQGAQNREWRKLIGDDLRRPAMKIPWREAASRRLRRVYLPLLVLLLVAWLLRVTAFAPAEVGWLHAASVSYIPGSFVWVIVLTFYLLIFALVLWPTPRRARGKLRETN